MAIAVPDVASLIVAPAASAGACRRARVSRRTDRQPGRRPGGASVEPLVGARLRLRCSCGRRRARREPHRPRAACSLHHPPAVCRRPLHRAARRPDCLPGPSSPRSGQDAPCDDAGRVARQVGGPRPSPEVSPSSLRGSLRCQFAVALRRRPPAARHRPRLPPRCPGRGNRRARCSARSGLCPARRGLGALQRRCRSRPVARRSGVRPADSLARTLATPGRRPAPGPAAARELGRPLAPHVGGRRAGLPEVRRPHGGPRGRHRAHRHPRPPRTARPVRRAGLGR